VNCPNQCNGHAPLYNQRGVCHLGVCLCHPGYSGPSCEYEIKCPKMCSGNGMCAYGKCFCLPGYTGDACDSPLDLRLRQEIYEKDLAATASSTPCGGCSTHGICFSGKCVCEAGYSGTDCSLVVGGFATHRCPDQCNLNGLCLFGKCFCDPGWTGRACEAPIMPKCPNDCNGKGVCRFGKCSCDLGATGPDCNSVIDCSLDCGVHGVCSDGKCLCATGFGGDKCNVATQSSFLAVEQFGATSFTQIGETSFTQIFPDMNFPIMPLVALAFLVGVVVSTFAKFLLDKREQMRRQQDILRPLLQVQTSK